MSNLQSDLAREKKKLEGIKNHDAVQLKKERQAVEELGQRLSGGGYGSRKSLQEREERLALMEGLSKQVVEEIEARISRLQVQLDQEANNERQVAKRGLEVLREAKKAEWIQLGGTAQSFDERWPTMLQDILQQKVMATQSSQPDLAEVVIQKRRAMGL